jgi:hypothetical protein
MAFRSREKTLNAARKVPGEHAGPHGSFPITDAKSVHSAEKLKGHAENPAAVGENIARIAKEKGLAGALPKTGFRGRKRGKKEE